MNKIARRIPDGDGEIIVTLTTDNRLRKTVRWTVQNGEIAVRAPRRLPAKELDKILDEIVAKVLKQRQRARKRNDGNLQTRARAINRKYFDGELTWHTIRWVSNMEKRLGSCSIGGTTDGDIRLSDRMRPWPTYVVDYVIAHELAHRRYPNHSKEFWAYLARFPETERARGFIEGVAFAENGNADEWL